MLTIYGVTNDRAKLLANRAEVDDVEAARLIATLYVGRGLIARICREGPTGRDEILEELAPQ